MSVKKSDVVRAVIVRTTKAVRRESGMFIKFDQNAAVIINADGSPKGSLSLLILILIYFLFFIFCEKIVIFLGSLVQ